MRRDPRFVKLSDLLFPPCFGAWFVEWEVGTKRLRSVDDVLCSAGRGDRFHA